jgi:hypothetical protein
MWIQSGRLPSRFGPDQCGRRGGFDPGLSDRGSRHLLKLRHQRPVRVGPVADPCDAGIRPIGLWRCAGEGDQIQRQRHFLDDPLDLQRIGEPGMKKPLAPASAKAFPRSIASSTRHSPQVGP